MKKSQELNETRLKQRQCGWAIALLQLNMQNKAVYWKINEKEHGEMFQHKHLTLTESLDCIKIIRIKDISENMRDITWIIRVGRLVVWCVVK